VRRFWSAKRGEELHLRSMLSRMGRLKASRIIQSKITLAVVPDAELASIKA
jgi:hypothetical protein